MPEEERVIEEPREERWDSDHMVVKPRPRAGVVMFLTVLAVIFFAALTVWAFQSVGLDHASYNETAADSAVQRLEGDRAV